jgi:pimeloyl-ACP methyl ester carboxylesterase
MKTTHSNKLQYILIGLLALVLVFSAASLIFIKGFYDKNFPRFSEPKFSGYIRYSDVSGYDRTQVKFPSGRNTLTGYVYGEKNQKGLVVISHGQGYGAEDYLPQTLYFVDRGWRVLAFDNTGTYESEGKSAVGLSQSAIDLEAALTYIEGNAAFNGLPIILFGHSWGGYAVAAVLNGPHPVKAIVSVSGYNSPMGVIKEQLSIQLGAFGYLEYPYGCLYQTLLFGQNANKTAVDGINRSNTPAMIIHGTADQEISYTGASIMANQGSITNPNVVYKTASAENRNDHRNLFKSDAALKYIKEKNQEYQRIFDRYNGNVPDEVKAQFYAGVDKSLTSQLDPELMNAINSFYESALQN